MGCLFAASLLPTSTTGQSRGREACNRQQKYPASPKYNVGLSGPVTHPAGIRVYHIFVVCCGAAELCFRCVVFLVDEIHQRAVDLLELRVVFDGFEEFFTVFLHGFEDADLKILFLIVVAAAGRDEGEIAAAVVLQLSQNFQLVFLAVFVGDADEIVAVLLALF